MNVDPERPRPPPVLETVVSSILERVLARVLSFARDVMPEHVFRALTDAHDTMVRASERVVTQAGRIAWRVRAVRRGP